MVSAATGIATCVSTGIATAIAWLVGILNRTWVCRGYTLNLLTIAVVAGNLDGCACQLLLQIHRRGEDNAATGYQSGFHLVHLGHTLGADTESHGSQTWQRNRVTLSGPSLNHFASSIPAGLHNAFTYSAAKGSLLNHLFLTE